MSPSLLNASPQTHVKIVVLALVGAIVIVLGSITAHVNANHGMAQGQAHAPVVKPSKPVTYSERDRTVIR
jgi:hypothetical protein